MIFWTCLLWVSIVFWKLEFGKKVLVLSLVGSEIHGVSRVTTVVVGLDVYGLCGKRSHIIFTSREVEDQFVSGSLTDLLSGDSVEVLCAYVSNNNVERRLLWHR